MAEKPQGATITAGVQANFHNPVLQVGIVISEDGLR